MDGANFKSLSLTIVPVIKVIVHMGDLDIGLVQDHKIVWPHTLSQTKQKPKGAHKKGTGSLFLVLSFFSKPTGTINRGSALIFKDD